MAHLFDPVVLREYDVRGVVGARFGEADARALGRSFGTRVRRASGRRVAVGYDGRLTSPALEAALVEGLTATGLDVVRTGLGTTPQLYFAEATLDVDGGVQVTGSHNPPDYNGFKMVLGHLPFHGADIQDLARLAVAGDWEAGAGRVSSTSVTDTYVARLARDAGEAAFRVGWDPGNGAAGPVIEQLVARLPGEHHVINASVDGRFPNHHPDPTVEANLAQLKALVVDRGLDFGVAFDGDGDRIGAIDGRGRVIWGDEILALLAEPVLRRHPGATIVADVKSSQRLFDRIAALGGRAVMAKSGHSLLRARMQAEGAPLAGELSGHIFFADDWYGFDDAQLAAVRLLPAVAASGRSLAELKDAMPALCTSPELRIAVDEARKFVMAQEVRDRLIARGATCDTTDGVRVTTADGWWLLRASNTEAALTVRAEGRDEAGLARLLADVDAQLQAVGVTR